MINTGDTFFDKELAQNVTGGLDEVCRLFDEFSFFCKKSKFLNFQLQFIIVVIITWPEKFDFVLVLQHDVRVFHT